MNIKFYRNKRVFISGNTGFKGSWMCEVLLNAGAKVYGYALKPEEESLWNILGLERKTETCYGDVRDAKTLIEFVQKVQPEIVIHMAAQPLVRLSYEEPAYTYETNVMGTVNILEAVRKTKSVKSFVNVTTDKVYKNKEWEWGYREDEELNGYDPYSNSKSCSELVTSSYKNSFFNPETGGRKVAITTCRAGNVIGGGDFAKDRIIPDCIRAAYKKEDIIVRNPYSTRPYQHVLEPVVAYLMIAKEQYEDINKAGNYNIGPNETDCYSTGDIVDAFCNEWTKQTGESVKWINKNDGGPHEANFLKLDCSRVKKTFGWQPVWTVKEAMGEIVEWHKAYQDKKDMESVTLGQIRKYIKE
ncbi:CDP-glucose 4,6-dehydratase [Lachnospiraceae bacterium G11]|nr:CDP-glucose 4,6-dehydratase [Lachnospiraceae bacterium G11]